MTESIHPDTTLGPVSLTISDLGRSLAFYRDRLGFQLHRQDGNTAHLGGGGSDLVLLTENKNARRYQKTSGLYHFAIRVPSRLELAQVIRRVLETRTPVQGFADHLVSEALYLPDPDGIGIEVYHDLPREQWQFVNGQLRMATDPIDMDGVMGELTGHPEPWRGLHPGADMGHMHLHVANIRQAETFYHDVLGFDMMLQYGPTASFLSAGGYHHHVGFNTWAGVGAPPPPSNAVGLRWFAIHLPNENELARVVNRVRVADLPIKKHNTGMILHDPSQNGVVLDIGPQMTQI